MHLLANLSFMAPFAIYIEKVLGKSSLIQTWIWSSILGGLGHIMFAYSSPWVIKYWGMLPLTLVGSSGAAYGLAVVAALSWAKTKFELWCAAIFISILVIPEVMDLLASIAEPCCSVSHACHAFGALGGLLYITLKDRIQLWKS